MPFDQDLYDGMYGYALIHLLRVSEREKLIYDCYNQLISNGYMAFVAISKLDAHYRNGTEISEDTFKTKHGKNSDLK